MRIRRRSSLPSFALATLALLASNSSHADVVPTIATPLLPEAGSGSSNPSSTLKSMDLGIPWVDGAGRILLAYGDAYTVPKPVLDWNDTLHWTRGGTLATTNDGRTFLRLLGSNDDAAAAVYEYDAPGGLYCGMISAPAPPDVAGEFDALPSAAVTVDGQDVVHFFTIPWFADPPPGHHGWCSDGHWTTGFSEFATRPTGTNGRFVRREAAMRWSSTSNFALAAFLPRGKYVYLFGTPAGRTGGIKLARAFATEASDPGGYEYWDGTKWQLDEAKGVYVAPAPAGELSVQFDAARGRFLMTYLDQAWPSDSTVLPPGATSIPNGRIVLRDAPSLEGPYGEAKELVDVALNGGAYGGFMYPLNGGSQLTINVSEWATYDVFQFRSTLSWRAEDDNLISDGDFEHGGAPLDALHPWAPSCATATSCDTVWLAPWAAPGPAAHSGRNSAKITSTNGAWHDVHQTIAVKPNTDYQVTFWAQGSHASNAYFGARTSGAPTAGTSCGGLYEASDPHTPIQELHVANVPAQWTRYTVRFNSGPRSLVQIYAGLWGDGAADALFLDDVSVAQLELTRDGGFEMQEGTYVGWPYAVEGPSTLKGIDQDSLFAHSGNAEAWLRTGGAKEWNAITQVVGVHPNTTYVVKAWVQTSSPTFGAGFFGVRDANGAIVGQTQFGASSGYTQLQVTVNSGSNTQLKIFGGYWSPPPPPSGYNDTWLRIDDISIENPPPKIYYVPTF